MKTFARPARRVEAPGPTARAGLQPAPIVRKTPAWPGRRLDARTGALAESRLARDFSGVRAHSDSSAFRSPSALNPATLGRCSFCDRSGSSPQTADGRRVQAQLLVGRLDDPLEREADCVAEQAVLTPADPAGRAAPPPVPRSADFSASQASPAAGALDEALAQPGSSLDGRLRQDMERHFGCDFSHVRVHTGGAAAASTASLMARAYTAGHHIVFGTGQFAPDTQPGRRLIAHELTHVVQQGQLKGSRTPVVRLAPRQDADLFKIVSRVWRVSGRDIIIIETDTGIRRAFYKRTGLGAKGPGHAPPPGGWAPFRGLEPQAANPTRAWFSKSQVLPHGASRQPVARLCQPLESGHRRLARQSVRPPRRRNALGDSTAGDGRCDPPRSQPRTLVASCCHGER